MQLDDVYSKALIIPSKKVLQEKSTSAHFFESLIIRLLSPFNAFLLPASTTESNDKNLRTILELLKPPDESFPSKAINFGAANVHKKI